MISIKKPKEPPKILREKGKTETDNLCLKFTNNKTDYESGASKFKFNSKIYGNKSVKNALIKAQHGKCFLCESKVTHIAYGDVEHFRPKGGSRQNVDDKELKVPGYYWLAYVWENLFFACQLCNQRFKKNLFPLESSADRAISHESNLLLENPLFINPEIENPENFISFRGEIPFAVDGNVRGKITIKATGIDRSQLNEMRLAKLKILKMVYILAVSDQPESEDAMRLLQKYQTDSYEYASATRANLRDEFRYILK